MAPAERPPVVTGRGGGTDTRIDVDGSWGCQLSTPGGQPMAKGPGFPGPVQRLLTLLAEAA